MFFQKLGYLHFNGNSH